MYYKRQDDNSLTVALRISGPGFNLDETTITESHDGWHWFETPEEAYAALGQLPGTIRAWQAKAVLAMAGLLVPAEQVIDGLPEPQRTVVMSAWANQADFSRNSPTVLALAQALGLDDLELDAMFEQASALTV